MGLKGKEEHRRRKRGSQASRIVWAVRVAMTMATWLRSEAEAKATTRTALTSTPDQH